jgi:hypothetical protein
MLPVPITERALGPSIERETGSAGRYSARRAQSAVKRWRCNIADASGGGSVE